MIGKKKEILLTAAALFHKKGFKATTLREIASNLNMEAPSLYNHIQSKQELLSLLLLDLGKQFIDGILLISSANIEPLEKLKKAISLHVDLSFQQPDTMSLMLTEYNHLSALHLKNYLAMEKQYEMEFRSILSQCVTNGQLVEGDLDLIMFDLLSTLRTIYAWISKHQSVNKLELEEKLTKYLLEGILR